MKSCNKVTFDVILAHKEHFDQKLIEIVQNLEKQNQALSAASATQYAYRPDSPSEKMQRSSL